MTRHLFWKLQYSLLWSILLVLMGSGVIFAQETDITQTPNSVNAGIQKSLEQQIGNGRGDINTPNSSLFIINRDPFRSIRRGRNLFQRKFTVRQGVGPRTGDGTGDIEAEGSIGAGMADSCAACPARPRGSAGFGGDVFTRPDSRDAPHLFGLGIIEMLADEITQDLRSTRDAAIQAATSRGGPVTRNLKSKGISYGEITALPDGSVDTSNVEDVNLDLRVRPFFHEGGTISMREFIVGALNAEMGLEAFDPDLAKASAGERIVTPSGMILDGSLDDIEAPPASGESDDPDSDGVANEVPVSLIDHMEFYLLNYFKPGTYKKTDNTQKGQKLFQEIQCTACHKQTLLIKQDRRVADVETGYNSKKGIFNDLFATATEHTQTVSGSGDPPIKEP